MFAYGTWLRHAVVAVFVCLLVGATITVYLQIRQTEQHNRVVELTQQAENVADELEKNMLLYMSTLAAIDRFVLASGSFSYREYELFTREFLDLYPGIHGLNWIKKVRGEDLSEFEAGIRAQGYSDYRVYQRLGFGKTAPVTPREVHFPVTYASPYQDNKKAHGYDTYSPDKVTNNIRQRILDRARDEKRPITTGRISLVQRENQYGLLVYHPIYSAALSGDSRASRREHLQGYVAGVFLVAKMLQPVAQLAEKSGFSIQVKDLSMPAESQFLYDSRTSDNKEAKQAFPVNPGVFQTSVRLNVAGHLWEIDFLQKKVIQQSPHWDVLLIGISASLLLGAILWLILARADWFGVPVANDEAPNYFVAVVVLTGLFIAVFTAWVFNDLEKQKTDQQALADAKSQFRAIQDSLSNSLDLMESISSFHSETGEISQEAFRAFVTPLLKKRRGSQSVGWVPRVALDSLSSFENEVAATGVQDFRVTEILDGKKVAVAPRAEYFPVRYVEPLHDNSFLIGLDLGFDPSLQTVLSSSLATGQALATEKLSANLQAKQSPRIMVFNPVYTGGAGHSSTQQRQDHLLGFVATSLNIEAMLVQTIGDNHDKMQIRVEDISTPGEITDIYTTGVEEAADIVGLQLVELLDFAGRQWKLTITPHAEDYWSERSFIPWLVLGSGVLVTALVGLIVVQLKHRHSLVEKVVGQRTAELQASQAFTSLIITTIPDLIFVVNSSLDTVETNAAFKLHRPNPREDPSVSEDALGHVTLQQEQQFRQNNQLAFEQGETESYSTVLFPDGELHTLLTKRVLFTNNKGIDFVLGISRDVTEREAVLRQLTRSNEELDEFAYIASHDLKEPLRGISNHAAMFLRSSTEMLDEDGTRRLKRIVHLAQNMESLISDLLYFSRVGRTDLAMQYSDLQQLITEVVASIAMTEEPEVTVTVLDGLTKIYGDKVRLSEVFRNLIVNGLKYNDSVDKVVSIGAELREIDGLKKTVVFIKDNGIGIDEKFHGEIFRIFKRLHKQDAYGGGTGSGLTFVKKIIDRHGGRVWLESSKGNGSTFYLYLPKKLKL